MGQMIFDFDNENYILLKKVKISPIEFLKPILEEEGDHHHDPDGGNAGYIIRQLISYHDSEGGAPEIDNFDVVDVEYDYSAKIGKVEITYYISRNYGCDDLNSITTDYETWPFKLDIRNCLVIVDAPDYETLSPSEEL